MYFNILIDEINATTLLNAQCVSVSKYLIAETFINGIDPILITGFYFSNFH